MRIFGRAMWCKTCSSRERRTVRLSLLRALAHSSRGHVVKVSWEVR